MCVYIHVYKRARVACAAVAMVTALALAPRRVAVAMDVRDRPPANAKGRRGRGGGRVYRKTPVHARTYVAARTPYVPPADRAATSVDAAMRYAGSRVYVAL